VSKNINLSFIKRKEKNDIPNEPRKTNNLYQTLITTKCNLIALYSLIINLYSNTKLNDNIN